MSPPRLWCSWTSHLPAGNVQAGGSNNARLGPELTYGAAPVVPAAPPWSRVVAGVSTHHVGHMGVGTTAARQHPILALTRASLFPASRKRPLCWLRALCPCTPCQLWSDGRSDPSWSSGGVTAQRWMSPNAFPQAPTAATPPQGKEGDQAPMSPPVTLQVGEVAFPGSPEIQ